RLPEDTYAAIRRLPSHPFFFTPSGPTLGLYTGSYATYGIVRGEPDDVRYELAQAGVTHVLADPGDFLSFTRYAGSVEDANSRWDRIKAEFGRDPSAFVPIYANPIEGTVIYRLDAGPKFLAAYERYRDGLRSLTRREAEAALADFEESLRLDPDLVPALNASGTTLYLQGRQLPLAEKRLRRAVELDPAYPAALVNLARLCYHTQRRAEARLWLARARVLAPADIPDESRL
ncbi:MAG TPA: tetratricopeptide repeat protein, partial [Elusimicrobiota bacterium]|nr:tetratricopeptide repeat protein [Elusimicrobiota bacterium]